MEHPFVQLFKPVLDYTSRADAIAYLYQHPVLMSPYYTGLLENWATTLSPDEKQAALRSIELKKEIWQSLGKKEMKPPVMKNPILELSQSVTEGRITEQYACQAAARQEFFVELMFPMVDSACTMAEKFVQQDWRPPVTVMKITLAALDARRSQIPENQQAMDLTTVESWLAIVTRSVSDIPDGRLFYDARKRGDAFADIVDPKSNAPGQILHRLGIMHLDPYVSGRSSSNLTQQLVQWEYRLHEEYGEKLAGIPKEELDLPPIDSALATASQYLRRAAALRSGERRGQTLKALAQSLLWQDIIDLPINIAELVSAAKEALELLPREKFPSEHTELNRYIEHFANIQQATESSSPPAANGDAGKSASSDSERVINARAVLATPVDEWVERLGLVQTDDLFTQTAVAVRDADPALALQLWTAIRGIARQGSEARRRAYDRSTVEFVRQAYAPEAPVANGTPVMTIAESLYETAVAEKWTRKKLAASLLWLAFSTVQTNQEEEGLGLLSACEQMADDDELLSQMLRWGWADLTLDNAVNAYERKDYVEAARLYCDAVDYHVKAEQPLGALDALRKVLDLLNADSVGRVRMCDYLVATLATNALALELAAGEAATYLIQFACRAALVVLMASGKTTLTLLLILLDVAKGRRFGAALSEKHGIPWLQDPRTFKLETELAELRDEAALDEPAAPGVIDEEMLLTAYVSPSQMQGGANATEQLRNLQIKFDTVLDRQLSSGDESYNWIPTKESVESLLSDDTVLMMQFIATAPSGTATLTNILITKEEVSMATALLQGWGSENVVLSDKEEQVTANLLSLPVSDLRKNICRPPGPALADSRALETLENDQSLFLGGDLKEKLAAFRAAGKKHLCICPHGPLHYYPFHLLGPEDQPLAAEWRITYLPSLRLLTRGPAPSPESGGVALSAIGLDFKAGNAHHLPPLSGSEAEAETIAKTYHAVAIVGDAATETAVTQVLNNSRHVHISTHGKHNAAAPAFQCIFVQPDEKDDGVIYAYELLRLDLHHLDMVTLSACETALGRFDTADNIRGIPAALLIAGVRTIVATLWNVESNAAARFFEVFYTSLKASENKLESFYTAQTQTRKEFPAYRDWGAFQMIGDWR
jgi:hypothetical protein